MAKKVIKRRKSSGQKSIKAKAYVIKAEQDEFSSRLLKGTGRLKVPANGVQTNTLDVEDDFQGVYGNALNISGAQVVILEPPFNPYTLEKLTKHNNTLGSCIDAMITNVDGTGFEIVNRNDPENRENDPADEIVEKARNFFREPWVGESFTSIRKKLRRDRESVGYGCLEVIRNAKGDVVFLRHMDAKTVRLVQLDGSRFVERTVARDGKEVKVNVNMRFRRFVQKIGTDYVYFKEFQSDLDLDVRTGKWAAPGEKLAAKDRATEILYFPLNPDVSTPYGLPRWIEQMPSVLGSRRAEENNLDFFESGGIPPFMMLVQGGILATETKEAIESQLNSNGASKQRGLIIEAYSSSGSIDDNNNVKVDVEKFGAGANGNKDSSFEKYDDKCAARTRRSFRLPPIFLGDSDSYNFACYDSETETLTDQGWIRYDEYKEGMRIACYNPGTESLEYHLPIGQAPLVYEVSNVEMYRFKTQHVDMLVTPRHKMFYKTPHGDTRLTSVEELTQCHTRTSFLAKIRNNNTGVALIEFVPPKVEYSVQKQLTKDPIPMASELFLEFMGWFISEGHSLKQGNALNLYQHEGRYWDEINTMISKMEGIGYKIWRYTKSGENRVVTVHDKNLYEWVVAHCGDIGYRKKIPQVIKDATRDQLSVFFTSLMKGDGTWSTKENSTSFSYATTSKQLADDVQEIAIKLGYRAKVRKGPPGTEGIRPVYNVLMSEKGNGGQASCSDGYGYSCHFEDSLTRETYTGKVYCFSVPTRVFVTRRNGNIAVQGNSAVASYMLGETQVFKPERDAFDEIINLKLMPEILGKESQSVLFRSIPVTVNDAKQKIEAIRLAADKRAITKGELVAKINEVTGLNIRVAEGEADNFPELNQRGEPEDQQREEEPEEDTQSTNQDDPDEDQE